MHYEENPTTGIVDSWAEPPAIADGSLCGAAHTGGGPPEKNYKGRGVCYVRALVARFNQFERI
jgi:hypothetical protein